MSGKTKRLMVMAGGTGGMSSWFGRGTSSDGARLAGALVGHRRPNGSVISPPTWH